MKQSQNFLASHWDWLVSSVGLVALVAGGAYFAAGPSEPESSGVVAVSKRGEAVAVVKMDDFVAALKQVESPPRLIEPVENRDNYLASGSRVWCRAEKDGRRCNAPIPEGVEVCPICGQKKQEDAVKVDRDTDGDGMPDEYEKKHGLNHKSADDYNADKDGDGFTNGEEFVAGTDPSDVKSHPDYLEDLKIVGELEERFVPFTFTKVLKTPAGLRFYFFDPKKKSDYGKMGDSYTPMQGEEIGKTGFKVVGYKENFIRQKIKGGGGSEKTVDRSYAKIVRISDGKEVDLLVDEKKKPLDVRAHLVFSRGKEVEFAVTEGDKIELYAEKYTVKQILREAERVQVVVESMTTGKRKTLEH